MPVVRNPDNSLSISGAGGVVLPWNLGEKRLQDMGLEIPPPVGLPAGVTAETDPAAFREKANRLVGNSIQRLQAQGKRAPEPVRSDATPAPAPEPPSFYDKLDNKIAGIPAAAARAADAVGYGNLVPASVSREAPKPLTEPSKPGAAEAPKLRGGARVVSMPDAPGGEQPRAGGGGYRPQLIKGGDTRVAYKIDRTNIDPAALQQAEDAEADASIDSKLAAQSLSDTSAQRSAALAERLGEQLDAEDMAVSRQAAKNQAIEAEYNRRQGEIDAENEAIDKMPIQGAREILEDRDAFTKFVSALSIVAGGALQGMGVTRDNPGLTMRDNAVNQAIAAQRAKRDARLQGLQVRETQLERLQKTYGNPEAAEAELRDRMERLFDRHALKATLDSGATDAAAQLRQSFAAKDQERAASRLQRQQALAGSITEQFQNIPDRVVGGPPKVNENDVQALARDYEKAGLGAKEGKAGGVHDLLSQLPEGDIPTPESRNIISRAARWVTDTAAGSGTAAKTFDTPAERNAAAALARIKNEKLHELSGAAVSPSEMERLSQGFNELTDRAGVERWVNEADRLVQRQSASVKAGYRPEVVETFEQRQRERAPRRAPQSGRGE